MPSESIIDLFDQLRKRCTA